MDRVPCVWEGFMPSKNDPTAVKRHRFENITTDFIIGRTLFVEGHKALPSTDTNLAR